MKTQKSEIGKLGEDIACKYLVDKGFIIIERNFRKPWGELDIIAKDRGGILVFVEVKTLRECGNGNAAIAELLPEENLTAAKLKKLKRTAAFYAGYNQDLINDEKGWRIDLVAISLKNDYKQVINLFSQKDIQLAELLDYCDIRHLENIA